jgi:hypothetical protein
VVTTRTHLTPYRAVGEFAANDAIPSKQQTVAKRKHGKEVQFATLTTSSSCTLQRSCGEMGRYTPSPSPSFRLTSLRIQSSRC